MFIIIIIKKQVKFLVLYHCAPALPLVAETILAHRRPCLQILTVLDRGTLILYSLKVVGIAPMARKTFDVKSFVIWANEMLAAPENDILTVDHKHGIMNSVETILHATGNYKGFRYLEPYNAEDPEFAFGGVKNVRRQYGI